MKPYEEIIGQAARIEYEEKTGKLFLVFEIVSERHKQDIRTNWVQDIEYKIIDKKLVLEK
ncbi:MAG TPA: hypothetical protein VNW06_07515 [Cytophagaceae bacterium]|jgi:hypothetical protein|nr:hypothetical protein [Cytophagaceae bacterium]